MSAHRLRLSAILFGVCGVWLLGLGAYFVFVRPPLLPEDLRYIGGGAPDLRATLPGLERWLARVFTVLGGFIAGTGALVLAIATNRTTLQEKRTPMVLLLAGIATVGTMSVTNMQLDSDFKWLLLGPALLWLAAVLVLVAAGHEPPVDADGTHASGSRAERP